MLQGTQVTGIPRTNVRGLYMAFFNLSSYYIHMYYVQKYTFQQLPIHYQLNRSSNLEPRDDPCTIPSKGEIPF